MEADLLLFLDTLELRRNISRFLRPSDWDLLAVTCKACSSQARVHNTGFYFPEIPASSYTAPGPCVVKDRPSFCDKL